MVCMGFLRLFKQMRAIRLADQSWPNHKDSLVIVPYATASGCLRTDLPCRRAYLVVLSDAVLVEVDCREDDHQV